MATEPTKRQPATTLPFAVQSIGGALRIVERDFGPLRDGSPIVATLERNRGGAPLPDEAFEQQRAAVQDADYLVHAANRYPELVAALRTAVGIQREFAGHLPIGYSPVVGSSREEVIASFKAHAALLAEIGEVS